MIGHIRAGGDLAWSAIRKSFVLRGYEALVREAERDRSLRDACRNLRGACWRSKKKLHAIELQAAALLVPTSARVEKLTRQLWEFGEEVRLATLDRGDREGRA